MVCRSKDPERRHHMTAVASTSMCELNRRVSDRIDVRLMWCKQEDRLWVTVTDGRKDESFQVPVCDGERAMDVFHHPYAYAAHHGVIPRPSTQSDVVKPDHAVAVRCTEAPAVRTSDPDATPA
jgi:hypothetical protein